MLTYKRGKRLTKQSHTKEDLYMWIRTYTKELYKRNIQGRICRGRHIGASSRIIRAQAQCFMYVERDL